MEKQKITIIVESDDGIDKNCLNGSWLDDDMFPGRIDVKIEEVK